MMLLWVLFVLLFLAFGFLAYIIADVFGDNGWVGPFIVGIIFLALVFSGTFQKEVDRAEQASDSAEKFRQDFANRCAHTHKGKLVDVSGKYSALDRACISSDGRWLEWY